MYVFVCALQRQSEQLAASSVVNIKTCCFFALESFFLFPRMKEVRAVSKVPECTRVCVQTGDKSLALFYLCVCVYPCGLVW